VLTLERWMIRMSWRFRREEHRVHNAANDFTVNFGETRLMHIVKKKDSGQPDELSARMISVVISTGPLPIIVLFR
tara:strand:+ start:243 stop:467 length:225 start_codon:yes stop_codon:yes gene_type:complete